MKSNLTVDIDDFCENNSRLDLLFKFRAVIPNFKANLFTIPGRCSKNFIKEIRKIKWLRMYPHGLMHDTPRECENWTYKQSLEYLKKLEKAGFPKGFKAPGWQISDGMYQALLKRNWWVADQAYNNHRRPKGLKAYILDSPNKKHYHVQNVCGNGLEESFVEIISLRGKFLFIEENF